MSVEYHNETHNQNTVMKQNKGLICDLKPEPRKKQDHDGQYTQLLSKECRPKLDATERDN